MMKIRGKILLHEILVRKLPFQICLSWWFWFRWLVLVKLVGHLVNFTFREHLDFNENIICNCIWATFPFSCSSMADC